MSCSTDCRDSESCPTFLNPQSTVQNPQPENGLTEAKVLLLAEMRK